MAQGPRLVDYTRNDLKPATRVLAEQVRKLNAMIAELRARE